jgi:hypothetical protein
VFPPPDTFDLECRLSELLHMAGNALALGDQPRACELTRQAAALWSDLRAAIAEARRRHANRPAPAFSLN